MLFSKFLFANINFLNLGSGGITYYDKSTGYQKKIF